MSKKVFLALNAPSQYHRGLAKCLYLKQYPPLFRYKKRPSVPHVKFFSQPFTFCMFSQYQGSCIKLQKKIMISVISRELQHHIKHFQPLALQSQQPFEIPDPVSQLRFAPYGRKSKAKLGSCLPSMTTASHVDNKT